MPSAHLLRTLASVAPGARVVDLAPGPGHHAAALVALGFDVAAVTDAPVTGADTVDTAADLPDASADWVVVSAPDDTRHALAEAGRVLRPGGWVWIAAAGPDVLAAAAAAGLVVSEVPGETDGVPHAIFRRPGSVG